MVEVTLPTVSLDDAREHIRLVSVDLGGPGFTDLSMQLMMNRPERATDQKVVGQVPVFLMDTPDGRTEARLAFSWPNPQTGEPEVMYFSLVVMGKP